MIKCITPLTCLRRPVLGRRSRSKSQGQTVLTKSRKSKKDRQLIWQ